MEIFDHEQFDLSGNIVYNKTMKPTLTNLKSLPYGGAQYVIDPDMEQRVQQFMIESINDRCLWDTGIQDEFLNSYVNWIGSTRQNTIRGLDQFTTKAYSNGTTEAFDKFYLKNLHRRLRYFRGEYMYHQVSARQYWSEGGVFLEEAELDQNDCVIISLPFADTGNPHTDMNQVLDQCDRLQIPVLLDMAYLGICSGITFDLTHPCISDVTFSLSKTFPVPHLRIGMRLTRHDDDDSLLVVNKTSYTNRLGIAVGLKLINSLSVDHVYETYQAQQQQFCRTLGVEPSQCVIFGVDRKDQFRIYNRGGSTNRLCFSKYLDSGILPKP